MNEKVLILHAPGTNRDGDLADAIRLAGGQPEIVPLFSLKENNTNWSDYAMLALPGGFSYGDALGAGRLWALDLQTWFEDKMKAFLEKERPVIGICNGFQTLVKAGVLPGNGTDATLTYNRSGRFECRWVRLGTGSQNRSGWLEGIKMIHCPVAHGEGRLLTAKDDTIQENLIAFQYLGEDGTLAEGSYPENPNGSPLDIAGITNQAGNVLGLMPHPENHIHAYQHPNWTLGEQPGSGLVLFKNGLRMVS